MADETSWGHRSKNWGGNVDGRSKMSQKWSFKIEPLGRETQGDFQVIPLGFPCRVKWYIWPFTLGLTGGSI